MLAVLAVILMSATVVAAGPRSATLDNWRVQRFAAPGPRGHVLINSDGGSGAVTLKVALIKIAPEYTRIILSTKGCGQPSTSADRLFNVRVLPDADRTLFTEISASTTEDIATARTMRLFRSGTQIDCARSRGYEASSAAEATDLLTIIDKPAAQGVIHVSETDDPGWVNLSLTLLGLEPGEDYRLVGSTAPCGTTHHPGDTVLGYSWGVSNTGTTHFASTQVTHDADFKAWASSACAWVAPRSPAAPSRWNS